MSNKKQPVFKSEKSKNTFLDLERLENILNEVTAIRLKNGITDDVFFQLFGYKQGTETIELRKDKIVEYINNIS